jgi:EKC/KEOPS complex subunit CGI121/TPRKB
MILETITLEHLPATHSVQAALFRDVANAPFLQSQLLGRNADFEYAFLDASTIISRFHLLSAVYKAVTAELAGAMRTPNVHSEIVFSLSSNNNVSPFCSLYLSLYITIYLFLSPSYLPCRPTSRFFGVEP